MKSGNRLLIFSIYFFKLDLIKIALIAPIFKAIDKCFFGNYRQISVLTCLSKLLEN